MIACISALTTMGLLLAAQPAQMVMAARSSRPGAIAARFGTATLGLEDAERAEAIRRAVELSGVHGARVLVPDAHVSLRVRPCCDVMVAHLRVWQHFSIDHPVYGRYSTAVHIS